MRLLLDTHVLLWALVQPSRLSDEVRRHITDARNEVLVSIATPWELCIKASLGKLDPQNYAPLVDSLERFEHALAVPGFSLLGVSAAHVFATRQLPLHHCDPFDRLVIAQAVVEGLTLVTHDALLRRYNVTLLVT
jgi:PIN domain nuclease of toxin-antitoxin system